MSMNNLLSRAQGTPAEQPQQEPQIEGQQEIADIEMNVTEVEAEQPQAPKKPEKKTYYNLDVTGINNYLDAVTRYTKKSKAKYIRELIEKDMKKQLKNDDIARLYNEFEKI